jgi:hypothetical protein
MDVTHIKINLIEKNILFMLNLIILIINFILWFKEINIEDEGKMSLKDIKTTFTFKNSDNFLNFSIKTFHQISNYLNKNFNYKKIRNKRKKKKKITLYSVNQLDESLVKLSLNLIKFRVKDKFRVKFDKYKPDYIIYDIFGKQHLNKEYNNSVKIAIFTENKIPDFNEADYAISQAHINYLDRYLKFPAFLWYNIKAIKNMREKVLNNPLRTKFCAAVISNNKTSLRIEFINELNKYKKVDMGGIYLNNVGGPVANKIEFLSSYKFSIAMENTEGDGYISEKIYDSFISGTIPIYYGDYIVDEYINPKSFILIKDEKNINDKIEYIKEIDHNNEIYLNILKEKILINENIDKIIEKEEKEFLFNIFEQEKNKAKRIYY